ncbi:MAG: zf-HC2 domain-containing protein [Lachnospiraceae bacterium]|nr:zf-HC2 domain-containing protein [Lachnospiraceae bacterium]
MECREFEKLIPSFLNNSLDYETMEEFRVHMNDCSACKEELSIQFLVQEGMKHLEKGDSFDLDEEFRLRLEQSRKKHARVGAIISLGQWVSTFILFVLGAAVIVIFG